MSNASKAHFGNYWPPSFGWGGAHDPEAHSSQLVEFTYKGVNLGHCHKDVHGAMTAILNELVPHISKGLHKGSCWSYSTTDNLPDGTRSFHSYAIAMDINWNKNIMGNNIPDPHGDYAIPRHYASLIALKYGFEWGGNWSGGFHDLMHFECHLTPADAAKIKATGIKAVIGKVIKKSPLAFPYALPKTDYFGPLSNPSLKCHGGYTAKEKVYVKAIQMRLQDLGFAPKTAGWADGIWEGPTTTAVKAWQKHNKYKQSGLIGRGGWKALIK